MVLDGEEEGWGRFHGEAVLVGGGEADGFDAVFHQTEHFHSLHYHIVVRNSNPPTLNRLAKKFIKLLIQQ